MAINNYIFNYYYKTTKLPYYYINQCISLRTQHKIIPSNVIAKVYSTTYVPANFGVALLSTTNINELL